MSVERFDCAAASPVSKLPIQQPAPKLIITSTAHQSTAPAVDLTVSDDAISISDASQSDDDVVFVVSNRMPSPKRRKPLDAAP